MRRLFPAMFIGILCLGACSLFEGDKSAQSKEPEGLHNFLIFSDRVYSGSEPHGEVAFESLEDMGVKTIISVDGARPNIEAAHERNIRYIHIPIGYDAVPAEAEAAIAKAMSETEGPVYFHCHHGKHRGPAAAAIALRLNPECTVTEALDAMKKAGTGAEYKGLWRDVERFDPAAVSTVNVELHEIAPVESLAAAMSGIDRTWDNIKLCEAAGWQVPPGHPDIDPKHEALQLYEAFYEVERLKSDDLDNETIVAWMKEAGAHAGRLRQAVEQGRASEASEAFKLVEKSCKQCHQVYRN